MLGMGDVGEANRSLKDFSINFHKKKNKIGICSKSFHIFWTFVELVMNF